MKALWIVLLAGVVALSGCAKAKVCKKEGKVIEKPKVEQPAKAEEKTEAEKPAKTKAKTQEAVEKAPAVEMKKVKSSNIDSVGYDAASKTLVIRFNDGSKYKYLNVPQETYDGLMAAKSKGKYFHKNIRDKFETKKCD